nr:hypothetical protein [Nocardia jejuensis]
MLAKELHRHNADECPITDCSCQRSECTGCGTHFQPKRAVETPLGQETGSLRNGGQGQLWRIAQQIASAFDTHAPQHSSRPAFELTENSIQRPPRHSTSLGDRVHTQFRIRAMRAHESQDSLSIQRIGGLIAQRAARGRDHRGREQVAAGFGQQCRRIRVGALQSRYSTEELRDEPRRGISGKCGSGRDFDIRHPVSLTQSAQRNLYDDLFPLLCEIPVIGAAGVVEHDSAGADIRDPSILMQSAASGKRNARQQKLVIGACYQSIGAADQLRRGSHHGHIEIVVTSVFDMPRKTTGLFG